MESVLDPNMCSCPFLSPGRSEVNFEALGKTRLPTASFSPAPVCTNLHVNMMKYRVESSCFYSLILNLLLQTEGCKPQRTRASGNLRCLQSCQARVRSRDCALIHWMLVTSVSLGTYWLLVPLWGLVVVWPLSECSDGASESTTNLIPVSTRMDTILRFYRTEGDRGVISYSWLI